MKLQVKGGLFHIRCGTCDPSAARCLSSTDVNWVTTQTSTKQHPSWEFGVQLPLEKDHSVVFDFWVEGGSIMTPAS